MTYQIEIVRSCTRSSTPDYKERFRESFEDEAYSSDSNPIIQEQKAYYQMLKEMSQKGQTINLDLIPKDPQIGKIVFINEQYGKIQTLDPVLSMNVFCFEKKDCISDEDDSAFVVGDRVIFTLTISDKKLYAANIRRVAKRTISSPDFSRLVMRQADLLSIDDFEL